MKKKGLLTTCLTALLVLAFGTISFAAEIPAPQEASKCNNSNCSYRRVMAYDAVSGMHKMYCMPVGCTMGEGDYVLAVEAYQRKLAGIADDAEGAQASAAGQTTAQVEKKSSVTTEQAGPGYIMVTYMDGDKQVTQKLPENFKAPHTASSCDGTECSGRRAYVRKPGSKIYEMYCIPAGYAYGEGQFSNEAAAFFALHP